jgi:hypothetical protein
MVAKSQQQKENFSAMEATFRAGLRIEDTYMLNYFHNAINDKVQRTCHFRAPHRDCYAKGNLILLPLWGDT